jgi:hypothetical protein
MTDEERKKLCARLRRLDLERDVEVKAADEIERLEAENGWLRTALRASQIGAGSAPTSPDDKNGNGDANRGQ